MIGGFYGLDYPYGFRTTAPLRHEQHEQAFYFIYQIITPSSTDHMTSDMLMTGVNSNQFVYRCLLHTNLYGSLRFSTLIKLSSVKSDSECM